MIRNILIIEDVEHHMERLCAILADIPEVNILKAYNVKQAYYMLSSNHIHLFLVDIILDAESNRGDVSGLNIVQTLRQNKLYEFTPVIFVTSLEDPKLFSYSQLHCYGYVEKPFDEDEVKKLVKGALNFPVPAEDKYIFFRKDGIIYPVRTDEILYIENSGNKTIVVTKNDKLIVPRRSLPELLKELDAPQFVMCSRFVIVNKNQIENVDYPNRYIKIRNAEENIGIGPILLKKFKEEMKND